MYTRARTHTRTHTSRRLGLRTSRRLVATHSLLECTQSTQTVRCRSEFHGLKPSECSSIEHRLCAAAANDRISNRRRTVGSSLISLNRYTTLKIAGAAHKLSTSRFSEPTFWKLPGTGHKMTIKVVTLSKVCEHRVAREEKENGRVGWVRPSRRLVQGPF